jgi:hypothetical protein
MLQTIEAEIDINGKIHWSEPLQLTTSRRVLITLLAVEEPVANELEKASHLRQIAERMRANSFSGNPPHFSREELHERR